MVRKRKQDDADGEVTRCVCGNEELHTSSAAKKSGADAGLFIQCDKCHVWQHGYCVGFSAAAEVPDVYYCEKCKPELHIIVVRPNGRTSRYIPSERKQRRAQRDSSASESGAESGAEDPRRPQTDERRRRTLNSREDVILQRVLEQSAQEALEAERMRGSVKSEGEDEDEAADTSQPAEDSEPEPKIEAAENDGDAEDDGEGGDDAADGEGADEGADEAKSDKSEAAPPSSRETTPGEPEMSEAPEAEADTPEPARKKRRPEPKRAAKRRAPAPKKPAAAPLQISKRCKPRIPPPRSTLADMRKRVQAIIEFSGRTQIDMVQEAEARSAFVGDQRERGADATADAMETLCTQHRTNIQSLEALTRKLLQWQELYG